MPRPRLAELPEDLGRPVLWMPPQGAAEEPREGGGACFPSELDEYLADWIGVCEDSTVYLVSEVGRSRVAWAKQLSVANGIIRSQAETIAEQRSAVPWHLAAVGGVAVGLVAGVVLVVGAGGD